MGEITVSKIIFAMANFAVLYLILRRILFKPVIDLITSRQDEVKDMYSNAEEKLSLATNREKESTEELIKIKKDGNELVNQYKLKAESVYDDIVGDAKIEADKIRERARLDANREMERAQADIKDRVVELSMMLTKKVLAKNIEPEVYTEIIDEFISEVGND